MNKKIKETESERNEYLDTRKIWIQGSRDASNRFRAVIVTLSTGGFVYTFEHLRNIENGGVVLIQIVRIIFGLLLILSVIAYFLSCKANEKMLESYDCPSDDKCFSDYLYQKAECYNCLISTIDVISVIGVCLSVVLLIISLLL